jgi:xanthosine utilization system XapX-like protein
LKATVRKFILAVNYTIAVIICLALVAQPQVPIIERALYGCAAILIGMGIRQMVKTLMPLDEDHMDKNNG